MSEVDLAGWGAILAKLDEARATLDGFDYEANGLQRPSLDALRALRALIGTAEAIREEIRSGKTQAEAIAALLARATRED